jgi:hypothetical protein
MILSAEGRPCHTSRSAFRNVAPKKQLRQFTSTIYPLHRRIEQSQRRDTMISCTLFCNMYCVLVWNVDAFVTGLFSPTSIAQNNLMYYLLSKLHVWLDCNFFSAPPLFAVILDHKLSHVSQHSFHQFGSNNQKMSRTQ